MAIRPHPDPDAFLRAAAALFAAEEALLNLPLAVATTAARDPRRYPGPNLFATAEAGGAVVGVAVRTPPHPLLAYVPEGEAAALGDLVGDADLPGVHGVAATAEAFAAAWCPSRGLRWRESKRLGNHVLEEVLPVPEVPGRMRPAEAADAPLVARWFEAFTRETHTLAGAFPPGELGRRYLADGRLRLWEVDGRPVAQAGISADAGTGARVGMVYTPPEERRRGRATALVAALTRELLAGGRRRCYLFTDLANPVSNAIYARIGYRRIAEVVDLDFLPA